MALFSAYRSIGRWRYWVAFVSGVFSVDGFAATAAQYRGFTIDESEVRTLPEFEAMRTATREQIDIVCAVGLPEEVLTFFQHVAFQLIRAESKEKTSPGFYSPRTGKVEVSSRVATIGHKPVLLHELLHAYHDQRIKGGYANREILAFYARGQHLSGFAPKSHMLQNEKEYFACAATAYLFGVTAQEPFSREKLKETQPEFFEYLKTLFGPTTGNYRGSLTR
jgi:hypothetical protein